MILDNLLTKEQCTKIVEATFDWCVKKFGNPTKTGKANLKIVFDRRHKKYYGLYYNKTITIYPNVCEDVQCIIRTIIHEYTHYLQMPNKRSFAKYCKMYEKYDYTNHPYEVEADENGKKYYKSCHSKLKRDNII